jgi:hypothetical protein
VAAVCTVIEPLPLLRFNGSNTRNRHAKSKLVLVELEWSRLVKSHQTFAYKHMLNGGNKKGGGLETARSNMFSTMDVAS